MNLTELKINEFAELLASSAPAPGGGAAAALVGAIGCALVEMVVSLTMGKPKFAEYELLMVEIDAEAKELRKKLLEAVNRDAEAYSLVSAAYKMEKQTEEQKHQRKLAIEEALKKASDPPFELMKLTLETIKLCEKAVGNSNPSVASDLSVSAVVLEAAARGAQMNVLVNLDAIMDEAYVSERRAESDELLERVLEAVARITRS